MTNNYEIALPIIGESNPKAFKISRILRLIGIIILLLTVFLLEVGIPRYIMISVALIFISLPFTFQFFIDEHHQIGLIKITENELVFKLKGQNAKQILSNQILSLDYSITEYEGETKFQDYFHSASQLSNRLGTKNNLSFNIKDENYSFSLKLINYTQKKKAISILSLLKNKID